MAENLVSDRQFFMQKILKQNTGEIKTVVSARSFVVSFELLCCTGAHQLFITALDGTCASRDVRRTSSGPYAYLCCRCGLFAFALLDRITGMWTVTNREWAVTIVEPMMQSVLVHSHVVVC